MKVVATVEARMGSTRLPGKVLLKVVGKPMLQHLLERLKRSETIDEIVVATTVMKKDDKIVELCEKLGVKYFRGSEEDVLDRVVSALKCFDADLCVQISGDCPLIDPEVVDCIVEFYIKNQDKYDFVSNDIETTYPPGLEVAVYRMETIEDSSKRTNDPTIREHTTLYIKQHPELYRMYNISAPPELHFPEIYLELDTKEDFEVIKDIYETFYPKNPNFTSEEVINFILNNPEIKEKNKNVKRRWKSFRQDG